MNDTGYRELSPEDRRLEAEIRSLGELRPDADFRARLRAGFVAGELAASPAPVFRRLVTRRIAWAFVPVALAAVLLVMLAPARTPAWRVLAVSGTGSISVDGRLIAASELARNGEKIASGSVVVTGGDVVLDVVCGDIAVLGLAPGTHMTLPEISGGRQDEMKVPVETGEVLLRTGPGFPGRRFVLSTSDGYAEITGTVVGIFKNAELACFCVLEGSAAVGGDGRTLEPVPAGQRKVMFSDGRAPLVDAIEPMHAAGLRAFLVRSQAAFPPE